MRWIALLTLLISYQAQATSVHSLSLGYEYINPFGSAALSYTNPFSITGNAYVDSDFFHKRIQGVLQGQYMMFPLKGIAGGGNTNFNLLATGAYVGVRTHPSWIKQPSYIEPTVAVLVGALYTAMVVPYSGSITQNTGVMVATQIVPGFDIPVTGGWGINFSFPVNVLWGTQTLIYASQMASLRYEL